MDIHLFILLSVAVTTKFQRKMITRRVFFTSFQQPDAHGRDLYDVLVVTDVSSEHCGPLGGETTGVQLHDLLTCLKDLQ